MLPTSIRHATPADAAALATFAAASSPSGVRKPPPAILPPTSPPNSPRPASTSCWRTPTSSSYSPKPSPLPLWLKPIRPNHGSALSPTWSSSAAALTRAFHPPPQPSSASSISIRLPRHRPRQRPHALRPFHPQCGRSASHLAQRLFPESPGHRLLQKVGISDRRAPRSSSSAPIASKISSCSATPSR